MIRALKSLAIVLLILLIGLAYTLHHIYGGGEAFPDRSGNAVFPGDVLEKVADLDYPPGNIAVSRDGRVFFTLHPEARPHLKVVELIDGQARAFPSMAFQTGMDDEGKTESRYFRNVLSMRIDRYHRLWTLDNGHHGFDAARIMAFDINDGRVLHEYVFPPSIADLGSHLNDLQVSPDGRTIYIADASFFAKTPALIVYDVKNRAARRVIENHESVDAEKYVPVVQGRKMLALGLVAIRPGVDSIVLDTKGEWLYFAPVTNNYLYRARTEDLLNPKLNQDELESRIERFAEKTMSDGLTTDLDGNIYISDLEHSAIISMNPAGKMTTLIKDERLRWPDGFSFGPDGWLYVACSSLQQVIGLLPTSVTNNAPYQIFRFKPGPEGVPGH